jgi:hypothetical protein
MIPFAKTSFSQTFDIILVSFIHIRRCDLLRESLMDVCLLEYVRDAVLFSSSVVYCSTVDAPSQS